MAGPRVPGGTPNIHPSGECKALSRGLGIREVRAFWKPKARPRGGNRGPEQLSPDPGWEVGMG